MDLRKHKRVYLSIFLVAVSVVIVAMLIVFTTDRTLPTDETLKSGIKGSAVAVKGCSSKKTPCSLEKIRAEVTVTDADGKSSKTKTDGDGHFSMKLAPGTYTASAMNDSKGSSLVASSQQVTVQKDQFTRITFNFE